MGTARNCSTCRLQLTALVVLVTLSCSQAFSLPSAATIFSIIRGKANLRCIKGQSFIVDTTHKSFSFSRSCKRRGGGPSTLVLSLADEQSSSQQATVKWSDGSEIGSVRSLASLAAVLISIPALAALLGQYANLHAACLLLFRECRNTRMLSPPESIII